MGKPKAQPKAKPAAGSSNSAGSGEQQRKKRKRDNSLQGKHAAKKTRQQATVNARSKICG
jgi:hypothetical protein